MNSVTSNKRILILGGGFAGLATALCLERILSRREDVEIALVSRDNFVVMTPLLFEVFSGTLDLRSSSLPVLRFLAIDAVHRGQRSEHRFRGSQSPTFVARANKRAGIRPLGHGTGMQNQSQYDPWCRARLCV